MRTATKIPFLLSYLFLSILFFSECKKGECENYCNDNCNENLPVINLDSIYNDVNGIRVLINLSDLGKIGEVEDYGIRWSSNPSTCTFDDSYSFGKYSSKRNFTHTIPDLTIGEYCLEAYAVNCAGESTSELKQFSFNPTTSCEIKLAPTPILQIEDDQNNDNFTERGERVFFQLFLLNDGSSDVEEVKAIVSSTASQKVNNITVDSILFGTIQNSNFPVLGKSGDKTPIGNFDYSFAADFSPDLLPTDSVLFQVDIYVDDELCKTFPFQVFIDGPKLSFSYNLLYTGIDGIISSGDTSLFNISIENIGTKEASNIQVEFEDMPLPNFIEMYSPQLYVTNPLSPNETDSKEVSIFISNDASSGDFVNIPVKLKNNEYTFPEENIEFDISSITSCPEFELEGATIYGGGSLSGFDTVEITIRNISSFSANAFQIEEFFDGNAVFSIIQEFPNQIDFGNVGTAIVEITTSTGTCNSTFSLSMDITSNNSCIQSPLFIELPVDGNISNSLMLHYTFDDGTATDLTGLNNDGLVSNVISSSCTPTNVGSSAFFNGINSSITIPSLSLDTMSKFTLNFWIKSYFSKNEIFLSTSSNPNNDFGFVDNDIKISNLTYTNIPNLNTKLFDGQWHMVTIPIDKSGSLTRLYFDGSEGSDLINTENLIVDNQLKLGASISTGGSNNFFGYIDNFRIYNSNLSSNQILNLYDCEKGSPNGIPYTFEVPQGLINYYTFDNLNFINEVENMENQFSGINNGIVFSNTTPSQQQNGKSADFDGSSYFSVINNFLPRLTSMSISFWMKSENGNNNYIFSTSDVSSGGLRFQNKKLSVGNVNFSQDLSVLFDNEWHFVTILLPETNGYSSNSNQEEIYIDNEPFPYPNTLPNVINFDFGEFRIGGLQGTTPYGFNGLIDNLRIYNRSLSIDEISEIYNSEHL